MTTVVADGGPSAAVLPGRRRWLGPGVGSAIVVAAVAGTWLANGPGRRSLPALLDDHVLNNSVDGVVLAAIAGLLLCLRPGNRVGWLLMYAAAANAASILGEGWALASYQLSLPGRTFAAWLASWVWATAIVLGATVLPAIYPGGSAVGRFGRWVVRLGWAVSLLLGAALAALDDAYRSVLPGHRLGDNPVSHGSGQRAAAALAVGAAVVGTVLVVVTFVWMLRRLRRATSPEREQLAWLVVSVLPAVVGGFVAPPPVTFVLTVLTSAGLVVGIVRHQLFDIKLVLRSGLVYGLLVAVAVGGYFAVVAVITLATPAGTVPRLFAAATVALLLVPAYRWLTRAAGRLVYGDGDDPVRALTRVGREIGDGSVAGLDAMVATVAQVLRSPFVCVRLPDGTELARAGERAGLPVHEVPLRASGVAVGSLVVAWRTAADRLRAADRRLVDALAAPVAVAVRSARLADEVSASRARIIEIREVERRRLRNDLHDSVGPSLSGVALGIEAALKEGDTDRGRRVLEVVHGEVAGLVAEVRHLIDDLGPSGLQPGGLVTALQSQAQAVSALGPLQVRVHATDLPPLHRSAEVVLHRVAGEALTNVLRHSGAGRAWLSVSAEGTGIRLVVEDDGCGIGDSAPGVGRTSMSERVASVGGTLSVGAGPSGGTRVVADVPVSEVSGA
jgi:two-component system, NarL family, sensor kinase